MKRKIDPVQVHQKPIKIVTKDASVCGVRFGPEKRPLIIMIHGFPGSLSDPLLNTAKNSFLERGYSVFLYELYGRRHGAHRLKDCTVSTCAQDLDTIVRHFKKNGAKTTYVVGHSFGGLIALSSQEQDFTKAALWDPSYDLSFTKPLHGTLPTIYLKRQRAYRVRWGKDLIIGEALVKEIETFPWKTIAKKFTRPFNVFIAGRGVLLAAKEYVTSSPKGNKFTTIKGADHDFADPKQQKDLFKKTADWFEE